MTHRKSILCLAVFLLATALLTLAQAGGTYTKIDYPGAVSTAVAGINAAGEMVGSYVDSNQHTHGFLLSGGEFTTIDVPGSNTAAAYGINDMGQIVGYGGIGGFLYDVQSQTVTTYNYPGLVNTAGTAIDNFGTIIGSAQDPNRNNFTGFSLINGTFTRIAVPGTFSTQLTGMNNAGDMVAVVSDKQNGNVRSFLYQQGAFQKIKLPRTGLAITYGINDADALVGLFEAPGGRNTAFIYDGATVVRQYYPGSVYTTGIAINNAGVVVGYFGDHFSRIHGFSWTPPAADARMRSTRLR